MLAALSEHGPGSRVDLGRRTGLSSSAISALTQELLAEGLLDERPDSRQERRRGRPAYLLSLRAPEGVVAGIDIGNTHIRVAVGEVRGPVLAERCVPLARAQEPEDALRRAATLVGETLAEAGHDLGDVRIAVVGVPVPLDERTGRVADNNIFPLWVGRQPGVELGDLLGYQGGHLGGDPGGTRLVVENDANLGALGEQRHGAGATGDASPTSGSLVYLKLATGIGAGLVLGGRLFRGEGGTAGEIGHVQVDPAGVLCRCGSRGCLETVVSVPRLLSALAPVTRDDLDADELGRLVREGHPGAVRVVADAGRTVGQVLASLVTVLNPGLLLVGGHLASVNELLAEHVASAVQHWAQPAAAARVVVRASTLGERSEVLGALALAGDLAVEHQRHLLVPR